VVSPISLTPTQRFSRIVSTERCSCLEPNQFKEFPLRLNHNRLILRRCGGSPAKIRTTLAKRW
jgi:hypothetical protein